MYTDWTLIAQVIVSGLFASVVTRCSEYVVTRSLEVHAARERLRIWSHINNMPWILESVYRHHIKCMHDGRCA